MHIDNNQLPGLAASYVTKNEGSSSPVAFGRRHVDSPAPDTVSTSTRQTLLDLANAVEDPARAARIHALTEQVQAGTYTVDPAALAGRLAGSLIDNE